MAENTVVERAKAAAAAIGAAVGLGKTEPLLPEAPRGESANPANPPAVAATGKGRIPLSVPRMKLETPSIPGYVCQWFVDRPGRLHRAMQAGYEFVTPEEISLNSFNVANSRLGDGNTNLGSSRVSVFGGLDENGKAVDIYLMKQQQEFYDEDQKVRADRNEQIAKALRGGYDISGNPHEGANDSGTRYVGQMGGRRVKMPELFIPQHLRKNFKAKG